MEYIRKKYFILYFNEILTFILRVIDLATLKLC